MSNLNNNTGSPSWSDCQHTWEEEVDSQFSTERYTDVVCVDCGCPGQMDNETKNVFYPAT